MWQNKLAGMNTGMMYAGTLFLSILSFCTTFYGMAILLDFWLAVVGALGIQIAMLGVAWNLMKAKENRGFYTAAFIAAAAFSVFFSFAAFHSQLKSDVRAVDSRSHYLTAIQPVLAEYSRMAKEALSRGRYQVDRIDKLVQLEMTQGWATYVDEGSNDPFVQSVIDGARSTVKSWERTVGGNYHQGSGEGIIVNYLKSKQDEARNNLLALSTFSETVDSLMLALSPSQTIESQYESANLVWATFPSSEAAVLLSKDVVLPAPPSTAGFVDKSVSSQYDFSLVIYDLANFDGVTIFALLLAVAVDLIVILMAFAGSYSLQSDDFVVERVKQDAARRVRDMSLDDSRAFEKTLNDNIARLRAAGKYGLNVSRVTGEYKNASRKFHVVLSRDGESAQGEVMTTLDQIEKRFSGDNAEPELVKRTTETVPGHFTT